MKNNALPRPQSRRVSISKIAIDPGAFQPRSADLNHGHVADLIRVLDRGGPLDPIRLMKDYDGFTVLDGHHSYEAYRQNGWTGGVPALVYDCTPEQGQQIAIVENSKCRLQMSGEERRDHAWRLTCEQPALSIRSVADCCGIGEATVSRMRAAREKLKPELPDKWKAAQREANGQDQGTWSDEDREEWRLQAREKLKDRIAPPISSYSQNEPELVLQVTQEIMGENRFAIGLEPLGFHEGEIDEFTGEFTPKAGDGDEDDADAAF